MRTAATYQLALGTALAMLSCGCITVAPSTPSFSMKSMFKPKVEQASHEEVIEDAPPTPKNPAKLQLAYGQMMEESGNQAEARKNYSLVIEHQPKNIDAILGLARLDLMSGNTEGAEQGFRRAVKMNPSSGPAQYGLGQYYASQHRWKESSECLQKAMLAQPDETRYRYALAVALVHNGDVNSALPHFIRTIGDAEAHYNVGLILQEEGKLDEAERQFAVAVAKKPELTEAQNWLAHLRQDQSKSIAAVAETAPAAKPHQSSVVPAGHSSPAETFTQPKQWITTTTDGKLVAQQQQEQTASQMSLPN